MRLRELKEGDTFYPQSQAEKATPLFRVLAIPKSAANFVFCTNLRTNEVVRKRKDLAVIKSLTQ